MDNQPIDQKFKNYFEKRELMPSDQTWDRLDAMLAIDEKPKHSRKIYWHQIAAGIVIVLAAGIWWSIANNKQDATLQNSTTVSNPTVPNNEVDDVVKIVHESAYENAPSTVAKGHVNSSKNRNTPPTDFINMDAKVITNFVNPSDIDKESIYVNTKDLQATEQRETQEVLGTKIVEKVNIDAAKLLADVERNISNAKPKHNKKNTIDPKILLAEAEVSANQSFLNKLYKNIQDNAGTVLVAVTNRNYVKE
jgi:hypothetical protein